jgi:hypothetical protein
MDTVFLSKLNYVLLPGKYSQNSNPETLKLHNKSYLYWKNFWTSVFTQNGADMKPNPDTYYRQDIVTHIMFGQEIVAMHMYSFFSFESFVAREHSYFKKSFSEPFLKYLDENRARHVMSIEYMTVDSKWRRSQIGLSLGETLMGLAVKVQADFGCDFGVAPSRSDVKVTQMCEDVGADVVVRGISMHNTPCDLIAIPIAKIRPPRDARVAQLVEQLWAKREDHTNLNLIKTAIKKAA